MIKIKSFKEFWEKQSRNYKVFLTRDVLTRLFGNMGNQYGTIYMRTLGASSVQIGFLDSVLSTVRMLLSFPGGILTDNVKRIKRLYLSGRFLALPVNLLKAIATSWPVYFWTRVWEVMTWRILMPTGRIISIASLKNKDRVRGLAINRTVIAAVGLIAPIVAAYAVTYFGGLDSITSFRPLFLIQFIISIIVFMFLSTQLEEPDFERTEKVESNIFRSAYRIFQALPGLKAILIVNIVRRFIMGLRTPFMQLYFYEVKNADAFIIAYQGTISTLVTLFLSVPIGNLSDIIGKRRMGYLSQIIYAICILTAILTPPTQPIWILLYSFLSALGSIVDLGWNAYIQEYIPLETRGRWMGVNTTFTALVGIPAPLIGGYLWELNPDLQWWIAFVFYGFLAIPLRMRIPEIDNERAQVEKI